MITIKTWTGDFIAVNFYKKIINILTNQVSVKNYLPDSCTATNILKSHAMLCNCCAEEFSCGFNETLKDKPSKHSNVFRVL